MASRKPMTLTSIFANPSGTKKDTIDPLNIAFSSFSHCMIPKTSKTSTFGRKTINGIGGVDYCADCLAVLPAVIQTALPPAKLHSCMKISRERVSLMRAFVLKALNEGVTTLVNAMEPTPSLLKLTAHLKVASDHLNIVTVDQAHVVDWDVIDLELLHNLFAKTQLQLVTRIVSGLHPNTSRMTYKNKTFIGLKLPMSGVAASFEADGVKLHLMGLGADGKHSKEVNPHLSALSLLKEKWFANHARTQSYFMRTNRYVNVEQSRHIDNGTNITRIGKDIIEKVRSVMTSASVFLNKNLPQAHHDVVRLAAHAVQPGKIWTWHSPKTGLTIADTHVARLSGVAKPGDDYRMVIAHTSNPIRDVKLCHWTGTLKGASIGTTSQGLLQHASPSITLSAGLSTTASDVHVDGIAFDQMDPMFRDEYAAAIEMAIRGINVITAGTKSDRTPAWLGFQEMCAADFLISGKYGAHLKADLITLLGLYDHTTGQIRKYNALSSADRTTLDANYTRAFQESSPTAAHVKHSRGAFIKALTDDEGEFELSELAYAETRPSGPAIP